MRGTIMLYRLVSNVMTFFSQPVNVEEKLEQALRKNNVEAVKELVKSQADANQYIFKQRCPILYWSVCRKAYSITLYLLAKGADINLPDKDTNWRPLDYAIKNNQESAIRLLIMQGANPRLMLPTSELLSSLGLASQVMQQFILAIEQQYQQLQILKASYEQVKAQADQAYKDKDMQKANQYYVKSAITSEDIAEIWQCLSEAEQHTALRNYYESERQFWLARAKTLRGLTGYSLNTGNEIFKNTADTKTYSEQVSDIQKGNSVQIRQRTFSQQKQQLRDEEQLNNRQLVV